MLHLSNLLGASVPGIAAELELRQHWKSQSSILTFIFGQSKWSPPPFPSLSASVTSACLYSQLLSLGREANKEVQGSKELFKAYSTLCYMKEELLCKLLLENCKLSSYS